MVDERYARLAAILNRVRARWRVLTGLRAWTLAAGAVSIILLSALGAQWLLRPDGLILAGLWT